MPVSNGILRPEQRARRHGAVLQPEHRRQLERAGWRTTLDYRENHLRGRDGRLLEVVPTWTAEAERFDGDLVVVVAAGATAEEAWALLRIEVEADRSRPPSRVRLLRS